MVRKGLALCIGVATLLLGGCGGGSDGGGQGGQVTSVGGAGAGGSAPSGGAGGNQAGGGSGPCTLPPDVAADIEAYRAAFDATYSAHAAELDQMAASGDGESYYTFQYALDATLSMYEATGDASYVQRALAWAGTMVAAATIIDPAGYANWPGSWCDTEDFGGGGSGGSCPYPSIAYQLDDFQGSTELARLARLVLLDPNAAPEDTSAAGAVREFVVKNVVEKWGPAGRGSVEYLVADAQNLTLPLNDKAMLFGRILLELETISAALGPLPYETDSTPWLDAIGQAFVARLAPFDPTNAQSCPSSGDCNDSGGEAVCNPLAPTAPPAEPTAITWDVGLGWDSCKALDTSHANRYPYLASEMAHRGRVFDSDQITGLARLLSRVLYNGNAADPRIRNFIDGSQCTFITRGPDECGLIYSGWVVLAEWDDEAFATASAVYQALMAATCNPTLGYNGSVYGLLELPAHLAKARRLQACPP
jgi:hypothetical protein